MWKKTRESIFPLIIALSALSVAGSAAFYSVFGLSKLFAGAATQVIIMAGSLEFAKLVAASLLYQYWDTINKVLKGYLMVAIFTLMVITSGGIYGFLSGAYQSTAVKSELLDKSLAVLNQKQIRFEETKDDLKIEKIQLTKSISDLRISLSNPTQVQYYDAEAEQVITTSSSSARRALQKELAISIEDRDAINLKLQAVIDSITTTDMTLLNKEISNEDERELGPLRYLAGITGWSMDKVVNWFLLLIIFVFDPLAIALVVAANFAFSQIKSTTATFIPKSIKIRQPKKVKMSIPEGKKFNKPYPISEKGNEPSEDFKARVKENQNKLRLNIDDNDTDEIFDELEAMLPEPEVKVVEKIVIKEVPVEVEKIVEKEVIKEVIKYDDLDLNKDGIVSKREIESAIERLKFKIEETRKQGDDAAADMLSLQLPSLKSKLSKDIDPNKKNYWL